MQEGGGWGRPNPTRLLDVRKLRPWLTHLLRPSRPAGHVGHEISGWAPRNAPLLHQGATPGQGLRPSVLDGKLRVFPTMFLCRCVCKRSDAPAARTVL